MAISLSRRMVLLAGAVAAGQARSAQFPSRKTMPETNAATIQAYYNAFNAHDPAAAASAVADDAQDWERAGGRPRFAGAIADAITRFPDVRLEPKEILVGGNDVVVRSIYSGTHRGVGRLDVDGGQMIGVAPAGRSFQILHIAWWTLKDGRIMARRARGDEASLLMQLGLIPPKPPSDRPAGLDEPPVAHRPIHGGAEQARNLAAVRASMASQNARDIEGTIAMYAADTRNHGRPVGREGVRRNIADIFATYTPLDQGDGIIEAVAIDDCVVARIERRLKHTGISKVTVDGGFLLGLPPTGREFVQRHLHWWTFKNGLAVEHWACRDDVGMAVQMGLLPEPREAVAEF